jgi:hypothetical protein
MKNMARLENLVNRNHFRAATILGMLLIVTAVGIFAYSNFAIQEREQMLNSADLTVENTWQIEGALQWWRSTYATVFLPLTFILAAFGTIGLVSQPLLTKMQRKSALETFADSIQRASREHYERPKLD